KRNPPECSEHQGGRERRADSRLARARAQRSRGSVAHASYPRKRTVPGSCASLALAKGASMRVPLFLALLCLISRSAIAQERPYFVTYDHYLEERGNLEIAVLSTSGLPKAEPSGYTAPWLELEYGVTGWWTAELYVEGVTTGREGSAFTGWRWENRIRPLKGEHRVNPVLYLEYENINEASRIQKEIVGHGSLPFEPIAELREAHAHELEGKLILSSAVRGWNVAENLIVEKNVSADEAFEFGYSVGVSRSLGGL